METASSALQDAVRSLELPKATRILIAVSGGPDSVALLDAMVSLASERGWSLLVGHVNHALRGQESEDDEAFVRRIAGSYELGVEVERVNTRAFAKERHLSLETAARELRYAALARMLEAWPGDVMATGHTQDDQAETVLLHLLRGTGLTGLAGMPTRRDRLVRPFLSISRLTILQALEERVIDYRIDSSNLDQLHRRNAVRSRVMPALNDLQPQATRLLARTASLLQTDADLLEQETARALELLELRSGDDAITASRGVWRALHPALRRTVLRALIRELTGDLLDIGESVIDTLEQSIEAQHSLDHQMPAGLALSVDANRFSIRRRAAPAVKPLHPEPVALPGTTVTAAGTLTADLWDGEDADEAHRLITVCGPLHALCDADRLPARLSIRGRRPGDRVRPLGAPGSRKLQDILVDHKVPRPARDRLPILAGDAELVWIPGIAFDQSVAVTDSTERVAHFTWRPSDPEYRDTIRHVAGS